MKKHAAHAAIRSLFSIGRKALLELWYEAEMWGTLVLYLALIIGIPVLMGYGISQLLLHFLIPQ